MSLPHISPAKAKHLLENGALLVDIRDPDEHSSERIAAAHNIPLPKLSNMSLGQGHTAILFHCKSGNRTKMNAPVLSQASQVDAYILDGGIEAWKRAGLPVTKNLSQPISMMRQVQIVAGTLALLGAVLGMMIAPAFYAVSGAVGAGLMVSGITGTCAMARVLGLMPWNRAASQ
jgi:rhodanese-related sulfurtransferase